MSWIDICSKTYDSNYAGWHVKVVIQYDDSSITTTSLTCRAIGYLTDYNGSYGDTYFIYSSDGGISRICYLGGTSTKTDGTVYYTGNSFTLTKTNTATYFKLPELRLCNDGQHQSAYTDSNGRGYAVYWNNDRHMWTTVNSGGSTISTNVYVTGIKTGSVTFEDLYNNSFKLTGTRGDDGNYNNATAARLWWATSKNTNGDWVYDTEVFGTNKNSPTLSKIITFSTSGTTKTRPNIAAAVTTTAEYGNNNSGWASDTGWVEPSTAIRQYKEPGLATNLSIGSTKGKYTLKENWTLSWTAANPGAGTTGDTYCPVVGYRVRLHRERKGNKTTIPIRDSSGESLSTYGTEYGTDNTYYYNTDSSSTSLTIYPSQYTADELKSGDIIWFSVAAYTRKGKDNDGEMMLGARATLADNDKKTVKNAGIMRVYNGSQWVEGQVHVYTGTMWKEAESVSVYNGSTWTEAQ